MNPIDAYLAELEHEAATTRRVLESVPESKYGWRPHEKAKTMGELCGHIASAPGAMCQVLDGGSFDVTQRPGGDEAPPSRDALLAGWDDGVRACTDWLTDLGGRANETWRLTRGGEELMAMPRAAAVRSFLFNHLYHHRGQLTAYLRAAGERVPAVYGPTADEDPFA